MLRDKKRQGKNPVRDKNKPYAGSCGGQDRTADLLQVKQASYRCSTPLMLLL